jgi:hypothetical protein
LECACTVCNHFKSLLSHFFSYQVETLKEKIISLELSNPESEKEEGEINGGEDEEGEGEPPTSPVSPTPSEDPVGGSMGSKKRRRKRSKRGKH